MSQKSSLPQVTRFVSRPLMPDSYAALPRCFRRPVLMVSRLILSRSSRMVWPRPK